MWDEDESVFGGQLLYFVKPVIDADIRVEVSDPLQRAPVEQVPQQPRFHGGRELEHVVDRRHVLVVVDAQVGRCYQLEWL